MPLLHKAGEGEWARLSQQLLAEPSMGWSVLLVKAYMVTMLMAGTPLSWDLDSRIGHKRVLGRVKPAHRCRQGPAVRAPLAVDHTLVAWEDGSSGWGGEGGQEAGRALRPTVGHSDTRLEDEPLDRTEPHQPVQSPPAPPRSPRMTGGSVDLRSPAPRRRQPRADRALVPGRNLRAPAAAA